MIYLYQSVSSHSKEDTIVNDKSSRPGYDRRLCLFEKKWASSACVDK